jgi:hypothetical protein
MTRENDAKLALPSSMQSCAQDDECVAVPAGCITTAVSKSQLTAARAYVAKAAAKAGACAKSPSKIVLPQPLCVRTRCGVWSVDRR